jgi:ribosomal protein S18 acetylase RimI-like enzyme
MPLPKNTVSAGAATVEDVSEIGWIEIGPAQGNKQGNKQGKLCLRPERQEDDAFRFTLFCESRLAELALLQLAPAAFDQLMRLQFRAQTTSYRSTFPYARFDMIELDGVPVGRIVTDRSGAAWRIVDQAITPAMRNRGLGTAIMTALMDEAGRAGQAVRLQVASTNDPSMRLYLRLGFVPVETDPFYIEMEWRRDSAPVPAA